MKYTTEKAALVIISLLKQHGIKRVIASPGSTNMSLVASLQSDPFFEMYSSVDERSAAYLACGLAAETGEPVVISCTGATASRNYPPGLTEAFYRKLPILAITSTQPVSRVGQHIAQVIDRSSIANDVARLSVNLPVVKDEEDFWDCTIKVNSAILELFRHGGGPAHINLPTTYEHNFSIQHLPAVRVINRICDVDNLPLLKFKRVGIFIGSHGNFSSDLEHAIDVFCEKYNGVVFCDHTSSYCGKYRVEFAIAGCQKQLDKGQFTPDLLIHIGEVTGDYYTIKVGAKEVWRVSQDGDIRDTFKKLRYVFQMSELSFFNAYSSPVEKLDVSFYEACSIKVSELRSSIPELPFSNIWIASQISTKLPVKSSIHFGILNSLRAWNFFPIGNHVSSFCNVGGFGIDGGLSSLVGASLADKNRLYFGVIGDLAFFYDMNVLGNRHLGKNLRLMVVNNGKGTEFRQYGKVSDEFGDEFDKFVSAGGHFANQSKSLLKNYSSDLGLQYLAADNKSDFIRLMPAFLDVTIKEKSIVFEVFTNSSEEKAALDSMMNIDENLKVRTKQFARSVIGASGLSALRKVVKS